MCAFISCLPKVRAFRKDSLEQAGELGSQSWLLLLGAEGPALLAASFQTLKREILKTNTLEMKCTHMYTHTHIYMYLWNQVSLEAWDGHDRHLHPSALNPNQDIYHYPNQDIFLFFMGPLSGQGSSSRDRKGGKELMEMQELSCAGSVFSSLLSASSGTSAQVEIAQ